MGGLSGAVHEVNSQRLCCWFILEHDQANAEIAFTDRRGRHWLRRAFGQLLETNEAALEHYHSARV